jgi:general secretion pathway protein A
LYASYFGLVESPFSIAPDPRYLFLSDSHREALAHLLYGIGEGGGFVQLTGEVGTGKTTLCRALLEQLPPQVDVAMVFNPRLTAPELLATVCEELRIGYPKDSASFKALIDVLYHYLLDAHARGRRTVLIIDEAQNLSREVLEQLRLLTNLETTREKLLQVILIGQPELRQLLARPALRQLAQRITARYHLKTFTADETRAYVKHRLKVAGQSRPLFDSGALAALHGRSRGIPRLINTICDRALLGAYATGRRNVTAAVVRRAAGEVLASPAWAARWMPAAAAVAALAVVLGVVTLAVAPRVRELWQRPATGSTAASAAAETVPSSPAMSPPSTPPPLSLATVLAEPATDGGSTAAFGALYARWRVDDRPAPGELACDHARRVGLRCLFRTGTFTVVRRLGLPAVLTLTNATGDKRYAGLTALSDETATLVIGEHELAAPLRDVERAWDGAFVVFWRAPSTVTPPLASGQRGRGVSWVRERLAATDGEPAPAANSDVFDEALQRRIIAFQRAQQLTADGIVGDETLLRLAAMARDATTPSLSAGPR